MSIKTKELKKIEKGCGKLWNETTKGFIPTTIHFCSDKKAPDKLCPECQTKKTQTIELCKKFEDVLDFLDVELFLEDVVDKEGNKVEIPKEIRDLWEIYWEHIKEKLKAKLQENLENE